jgi:hypothetical protein
MIQIAEEMRARLNRVAESEQTLVLALGEALSSVDQRLLQEVRNITTGHEGRRGNILHELQSLASRIGAFPAARELAPGAGIRWACGKSHWGQRQSAGLCPRRLASGGQ